MPYNLVIFGELSDQFQTLLIIIFSVPSARARNNNNFPNAFRSTNLF